MRVLAATTEGHLARFFSATVELGLLEVGQAVGLSSPQIANRALLFQCLRISRRRPRTTIALQQPEPLTVAAASPEACYISGSGSRRVREADTVFSHQVKLLRADNLPQAKLTPKVLEAPLRIACAELCSASCCRIPGRMMSPHSVQVACRLQSVITGSATSSRKESLLEARAVRCLGSSLGSAGVS